MNEPIDQAFAAEQDLFQQNLVNIRVMDDAERDTALKSEKRRHLWAICGIWHTRQLTPRRATGSS